MVDDREPEAPSERDEAPLAGLPLFFVDPDNEAAGDQARLKPKPDRRIEDYQLGGWVSVFFGLVVALSAGYFSWDIAAWDRDGRLATATITDLDHYSKSRVMTFRYRVPGQEAELTRTRIVDNQSYWDNRIGGTIPVRYRASKPTDARPEADFQRYKHNTPLYAGGASGFLLLMGLGALGWSLWLKRRDEHLLLQFTLLDGEVIGSGSLKNETWIRYAFTSPFGERVERRYHYLSDMRELPPNGSPIKVAYQNPRYFRPL